MIGISIAIGEHTSLPVADFMEKLAAKLNERLGDETHRLRYHVVPGDSPVLELAQIEHAILPHLDMCIGIQGEDDRDTMCLWKGNKVVPEEVAIIIPDVEHMLANKPPRPAEEVLFAHIMEALGKPYRPN